MAPAPWDSVPARDTCFVLVTGANSGVGLGICQRLMDDFLSSRSLTSHLVLIPTTRSASKSEQTSALLRRHLLKTASSARLASRGGTPGDAAARVHVLAVQLDLCDFSTIRRAAGRLRHGTLRLGGLEVRIPRLDAVILNAGLGGWTGVDWLKAAHNFVTAGWVQASTWPTFKACEPGMTVRPLATCGADGAVGHVFCANVLGHYLLAHGVLPLLRRRRRRRSRHDDPADLPPGRLIWEGSIETAAEHFSVDDLQALRSRSAYESSKRLTDILCLTVDLPAVRPHAASFWEEGGEEEEDEKDEIGKVEKQEEQGQKGQGKGKDQKENCQQPEKRQQKEEGKGERHRKRTAAAKAATESAATTTSAAEATQKPRMYVSHPGIVVTTILPLPVVLLYAWRLAAYVARWLGSPWHTNTSYGGAAAMVWLALAPQSVLDSKRAGSVKWGSACDFWGNSLVKKTEVDGWGWEGRVEGLGAGHDHDHDLDLAPAVLSNLRGRRSGASLVTDEARAQFEDTGAACWREMERLRVEWETRMSTTAKAAAT